MVSFKLPATALNKYTTDIYLRMIKITNIQCARKHTLVYDEHEFLDSVVLDVL